jgi:hypothetical protein
MNLAAVEHAPTRAKKRPTAPIPAPRPYARTLFAQLARRFIVPANGPSASGSIFDIETDGLLAAVTKVHCICVIDLGDDRVREYGPGQLAQALAHLARADTLIGHNVLSYDLPVLRKLYGWAPATTCRVIDTLVAGRLILPNLGDIDAEVAARAKDAAFGRLRGGQSLDAWGARLGVAKIGAELTDWSEWSPEVQARCAGDVHINAQLWQFLQPDGYPHGALELEHAVAPICDRISTDGVPFDLPAARQLEESWKARRAELAERLRTQFPALKNPNSRQQIAALLKERGWQAKKLTEKTKQPVIDEELLDALPAIYPEFAGLSLYHTIGRRLAALATGAIQNKLLIEYLNRASHAETQYIIR